MATTHQSAFNYWIDAARWDLQQLQKYSTPGVRRRCLEGARVAMERARAAANQSACAARKALCFRVLNWIRADLRKTVSP